MYNTPGQSFNPLDPIPIVQPVVQVGVPGFQGLTTAQCAANGALTAQAVTSAGALIEGAKRRTTGMTIVVPIDQAQTTFGNDNPISGPGQSATPIQAVLPTFPPFVNPNNQTFTPSNGGFALPPGQSMFVGPFNDPMYAITAPGITSTIYWMDT